MITFLLVVQVIIAVALVGVILMQRSEGGGLGIGGSPGGLMSARGATDFLTRTTTILAGIFILLCIVMAAIAAHTHAPTTLDTTLVQKAPATPAAPPLGRQTPANANPNDPLAAIAAPQAGANTADPFANIAAPAKK